MTNKTQNIEKSRDFILLLVVSLFLLLFWDFIILYPIKLFTVLLHEISHGFTAYLTGGYIKRIEITPSLGGNCITEGGNELLIAFSGYPGSLFWGALIYYGGSKETLSKWIGTFIAVLLVIVGANYLKNNTAIIIAFSFALLFFLSARYFKPIIHSYFMKILGLTSCIYILIDIKTDLFTNSLEISDAKHLEILTGISVFIWGIFWLAVSALIIYLLYKKIYKTILS